jgi:glutamine synthetase
VCIVTSLGKGVDRPSRNRTVLVGLIRDTHNPLSTRFELRSPNPKSNTYLVLASAYMAMVDGMRAAMTMEKSPEELEKSLSKKHGEDDFYLETEREYRSEEDVFVFYTEEEREHLFGKAPATVWENLSAMDKYPEKTRIFNEGGVMDQLLLESYKQQILSQWKLELHDRLIPNTMVFIRSCKRRHSDDDFSDYDMMNWTEIDRLRHELGKDTISEKCLLTRAKEALDNGEYDKASAIQLAIKDRVERLTELYNTYKKNLL